MQDQGKRRSANGGASRVSPPSRMRGSMIDRGAAADAVVGGDDMPGSGSGVGTMNEVEDVHDGLGGMPGPSMEGNIGSGMAGGSGMDGGRGDDDDAMGGTPPRDTAGDAGDDGTIAVLVELRADDGQGAKSASLRASAFTTEGFALDEGFEAIPMTAPAAEAGALRAAGLPESTVIVRGNIAADRIAALEARPDVVKVWRDTRIEPFGSALAEVEADTALVSPVAAFGACPIGTCDCASGTPKGTMADVAAYLGVDQIWSAGYRGEGIVVGVVDGGITAQGRPINASDTGDAQWPNKLVPNVIGGFPVANWGTTGVGWGWHGNMTSTDTLGMAPNARVYDIRIAGATIATTISAALSGFQWAIDRHRIDGTPQILTNSWGIFQESWDPAYARDANHPFTRKVIEALNEGIIVLFAAGNCGGTCPDGRCGADNGPGRSIWGANSHPRVITVGAVNKNEQFVGYSSQGPGALDPNKPDFCGITHFTGFFNSDSGTSAATPIAAGVVALLKQASPA